MVLFIFMGFLWRKIKEPSKLLDGKDALIPLGLVAGTLGFGAIVPVTAGVLLAGGLAVEGVVGIGKWLCRKKPEPPAPRPSYSPLLPPPPPTRAQLLVQAQERKQELIALAKVAGLPACKLNDQLRRIEEAYQSWVQQLIEGK